jgi:hypothetical protein
MSYLRYVCLIEYSGVQHILFCVFCLVCLCLVCLRFSLTFIKQIIPALGLYVKFGLYIIYVY